MIDENKQNNTKNQRSNRYLLMFYQMKIKIEFFLHFFFFLHLVCTTFRFFFLVFLKQYNIYKKERGIVKSTKKQDLEIAWRQTCEEK